MHSQTTKWAESCITKIWRKKMDARIESSLKRIKEAYLDEKRKKLIPEIRVIDICQKACVNKTTFYRHYRDIYDLADEVEIEVVREILGQMKYKDKLLTEPELFARESYEIFQNHKDIVNLVFDHRIGVLIDKIEKEHVEYFSQKNYSSYETLQIRFCIGGAAHIMTRTLSPEESEEVQDILIQFMNKLCR